MPENFITKLETEHYYVGSFDAYESQSRSLIERNSGLSKEEVEAILKSMPTTDRAAITNKKGEYIGYIGLFDVDAQNNQSSLRLETEADLTQEEQTEILEEFKKYMKESLNINDIEEQIYKTKTTIEVEKKKILPRSNIILPSKMLIPGISQETLITFLNDYHIPKLQFPFTIKSSDRIIGIIGLSNVSWSNHRANLNIFLDKNLGSDIVEELSGYLIDDYINYAHQANVHNINLLISGKDNTMADLLEKSCMNYYGQIPFSDIQDEYIGSSLMFQHIPGMKKEKKTTVFDNKTIALTDIPSEKTELSEHIELENGFKLVSPKAFEKENIDTNKVLEDHIKALQNRQGFAIPLGEDKFILQRGNGNYGISRAFSNYSYIVLDEKNNYAGYINTLRNNADLRNAEVEIGIAPQIQHKGLGTIVINRFYDELFSLGYASITSAVFEFNHPSLRLHEKVAQLNGIRLDSYYINGKLWDMSFYSKINPAIEKTETRKH